MALPEDLMPSLCQEYEKNAHIKMSDYERWDVKRGLRNADGTGVIAGITEIGNVRGYYIQDGDRVPMEGQLTYRGIDLLELVQGFTSEHRFGFAEDMILKAPSADVMNKLARGVLTLYSYDDNPEDMTLSSELRRAVVLIARTPQIVAHAFAAKRRYFDGESLYLHVPQGLLFH